MDALPLIYKFDTNNQKMSMNLDLQFFQLQ